MKMKTEKEIRGVLKIVLELLGSSSSDNSNKRILHTAETLRWVLEENEE